MAVFGVSPAFIVSLYGTQFSVADFCDGLDVVQELGFEVYQPEIFVAEQLDTWIGGGTGAVAEKGHSLGLKASQFVAHYMHAYFATPAMVASDAGLDEFKKVVPLVAAFEGCGVITIPVLPMTQTEAIQTPAQFDELQKRAIEKIAACLTIATNAGLKLAFEIVPQSIIGNIDRFLAICETIGSPDLGLNLDTGHAWATRDPVHWLPLKLPERIFGLHLKDNNSDQNLPLAPGKGTINWRLLLENLAKIGYVGSLDIEIGCEPDQVRAEYTSGRDYLTTVLNEILTPKGVD